MENNKTYCRMPFVGFQATHKDTRLCCATQAGTAMNGEEFWNSDYIKDVRDKMVKGLPVNDCQKCYNDEAAGKVSLRNHYNNRFKEFEHLQTPTVLDEPRNQNLIVGHFTETIRVSNRCVILWQTAVLLMEDPGVGTLRRPSLAAC